MAKKPENPSPAFEGKIWPQFVATGAATLGVFSLGSVLGWTSPSIPQLKASEEFKDTSLELYSWIGSSAPIGAFVSGPIAGYLVEKIGRKKCMLLVSPPFIVGWLLIAFAYNVEMILAGRFITGLCGGAFSLSAPIYTSEIAESRIRGILGSSLQLMINCGVLFTYVLGTFVNWQILTFACAGVPILFLVIMIFMPESPRYLYSKNYTKDCVDSLCWLRGADHPDQIASEILLLQKSIEESQPARISAFKEKCVLVPLGIALCLMLFQQWNGNNAIIFYTVSIFKDAGTDLDPNVCTIIVGGVQVGASIASGLLMDKAGRRVLLIISGVLMTCALIVLGIFFYLKYDHSDFTKEFGWIPLLCLILFIVAFSIGFGPIAWMMNGEILAPHVKGVCSAMATSFNWLNTFIVTKAFDNIKSSLGIEWCFWIFGIAAGIGTLFAFFCVPETKGKTLSEIQEYFEGGKKSAKITTSKNDREC